MIFFILLAIISFLIYMKIKKNKIKKKYLNERLAMQNTTSQEPEKKIDEDKILDIKYLNYHVLNNKYPNKNELLGLSINRIEVRRNSFVVFICVYNLSGKSLSFNIKDSYYVTESKEQIRSVYNRNLLSNSIENNTIISGFNVIRELEFISYKNTFSFDDAIIVNFDVNGYEFFLTESMDLIQNTQITSINI